jgi:UDP-glucuronate 4-epimerase
MRVLVTGAAGFIGHHLCQRLLARGDEVVGVDHLASDDPHSAKLKAERLELLRQDPGFAFYPTDLRQRPAVERLFIERNPQRVVHLAAEVGVRGSDRQARAYVENNVLAFTTVLERCRSLGVEHLVFASSSSVYGASNALPFRERYSTEHPVSVYGATKKACELLAHAFSFSSGLPVTGLRLFSVYGPSGRPDMAPMKFTRAMLEERTIELYGSGQLRRDFTYVDDVVEATVRILDRAPGPSTPCGEDGHPLPYRVYNIGSGRPVTMLEFIEQLEEALGIKARIAFGPAGRDELATTWADVTELERDFGFRPQTPLPVGLAKMVDALRLNGRNHGSKQNGR